ncbi:MAG: elongation factor G [Flavobacteriales bacterium]|nr:MAG: elongation factor G [Flavobacteriales bacterium]
MKNYDSANIKNVSLLGHAGSGKTTLAECMLFEAGAITRRGNVEDKNTVSDYHDIEKERGNSVYATLLHTEWKESKINIIDTPGFDDFAGEVISALKVTDCGIVVLNSQYGVEVGTETIWQGTEQLGTPVVFAINQLDHEKSDFESTLQQAKSRFGNKVTVFQYPLNPGNGFDAIIDVLRMTMYKFPAGGSKPEKQEIPDDQKERAEQLHKEIVEMAAENDESLMELYFEKDTLSEDEIRKGLKIALANRDIFPVFCMSAKNNMGSGRLMGFINNVVPSPTETPVKKTADGAEIECNSSGKPCAFVFKTVSEQNLGEMSLFKIYSGTLKGGDELYNEKTYTSERISQLFAINGKNRVNITQLSAGDIGATVKLKKTHTNDTLHIKGAKMAIEPIEFPQPTASVAIVSQAKGQEEKLAMALHQINEEDPSVIIEQSAELKQTILHGLGELQLSMIKWKLENAFKLSVGFIKPKIPYRETIQGSARADYRHKKQSGGSGQFGEVYMHIEPYVEGASGPNDLNSKKREITELKWGGKLEFVSCIVGGSIDQKFMPSILKGVLEKMQEGPITGCPARDISVYIYDGKMHPVDSNDISFKIAGLMAFKDAFMRANPQLLEPIYEVEVLAPEDIMGDVMSDMQSRRAMILGMEAEGLYQRIRANVPLAELHKYSSALQSISQGRAKHKRKFAEYQPVPPNIQQQLMTQSEKELQEA